VRQLLAIISDQTLNTDRFLEAGDGIQTSEYHLESTVGVSQAGFYCTHDWD
jgi:hypothetical protein